jgi:hypothetical protein
MGILRSFDRRREQRNRRDLPLMVWVSMPTKSGVLQEAWARDISLCGALMTGLDADLKSGDLIGILSGKKKARYRVVWGRYDGAGDKMQAAIHRLESDAGPWLDLLTETDEPETE